MKKMTIEERLRGISKAYGDTLLDGQQLLNAVDNVIADLAEPKKYVPLKMPLDIPLFAVPINEPETIEQFIWEHAMGRKAIEMLWSDNTGEAFLDERDRLRKEWEKGPNED